jgi:hypothetical protein
MRPPLRRGTGVLGLLLLTIALCCGCGAAPEPGWQTASGARGTLRALVPPGWEVRVTYRDTGPVGEGVLVQGPDGSLLVYASATALAEHLGDDPLRRDRYPFRRLVGALDALGWRPIGEPCPLASTTPFESDPYYGALQVFEPCGNEGMVEARVLALTADRTTAVAVDVLARDADRAVAVARRTAGSLTVDVEALPTGVLDGPVIVAD